MASKEKDRIISASVLPDEQSYEYSLRPKRLTEYIGQQKVKDNLAIAIEAAKAKAEQLAKDLGIRLVRIVNFSEGGNYPIYGRAEFKALSADDAIPLPEIPVGENKIVSNVTITYEVR